MSTLRFPDGPRRRPAVLASPRAPPSRQQLDLPRPSPNASVSQTVGVTEITIKYSRPGVKGRQIWGKLVPYGEVWRTGANENTTIKFSTPVKVDGHELPAGIYGLQTIPTAGDWTVIFSKDADEWGAFSYKQEDDALRIQAKPQPAEFRERMAFDFDDVTDTPAKVVLHWEKLKVPFTVEVDTPKLVAAKVKKAVTLADPVPGGELLHPEQHLPRRRLALARRLDRSRGELRQPARQGHAARQEERPQPPPATPSGRSPPRRPLQQPPAAQQIKDLEGIAAVCEEGEVGRCYAVTVAARSASQAPRSTT